MACRQRLLKPLIMRTTVLVSVQASHECVSVEHTDIRYSLNFVGRDRRWSLHRWLSEPNAACARSMRDGHPPHHPCRPVSDCQCTQIVARCRGPRCRYCREPPRPLASLPFSQPCRLACQVAIVAYGRRRTIEPCGLLKPAAHER